MKRSTGRLRTAAISRASGRSGNVAEQMQDTFDLLGSRLAYRLGRVSRRCSVGKQSCQPIDSPGIGRPVKVRVRESAASERILFKRGGLQ